MKYVGVVLIVGLLCAFSLVAGAAPECTPDVAFVGDVTAFEGAVLRPGGHFTKVWQVRNSGTCSWSREYAVEPVEGERFGLDETGQPLPEEVPAGQDAYLMLTDLVAPQATGEYTSTWRLRDDAGQPLGPEMHVQIRVGPPEPGWMEYEDENHRFTLWHPPQWEVHSNHLGGFSFVVGHDGSAFVDLQHGLDVPPHFFLQMMVFLRANSGDMDVLGQGRWVDGRGTYEEVEFHSRPYMTYGYYIITPIGLSTDTPAEPQREYLIGGIEKYISSITAKDRQTLAQVVRTLHLLGENPDGHMKPLPPEPPYELPSRK